MTAIDNVPAADWQTWAEETGGTLLDVREPDEWEQGTLPNALLIPTSEIMERVDEVPNDRPVLCICRSGGRSQQVAAFLTFNGYKGVANMSGGMKALGMQD